MLGSAIETSGGRKDPQQKNKNHKKKVATAGSVTYSKRSGVLRDIGGVSDVRGAERYMGVCPTSGLWRYRKDGESSHPPRPIFKARLLCSQEAASPDGLVEGKLSAIFSFLGHPVLRQRPPDSGGMFFFSKWGLAGCDGSYPCGR